MATVNNPLTTAQIAAAAKAGGFPDNEVAIAVAIAMAESGGDPRAHNPVPPDNSYGLWQINMLGKMGADRRAQFKLENNEALFNPTINARVAYSIRRTQGWNAWSVYTSGKYRRHLGEAEKWARIPYDPEVDKPNYPGSPLEEMGLDPIQWIQSMGLRVAMFIGGGMLIIIGLALLVAVNQRKLLGAAASIVNPVKKAGKLA